MEDFKAGRLDALVSTTVIEVGVDVPNASVMVIENAERYGLSALHQLRGRVGRGAAESWCFLVSDNTSEVVQKRLKFLCSTTDGFALLTPDMIAKAATKLKKDKVPTINGKYVAVVHPSVVYDLRKSEAWMDSHKYSAVTEIFNGEIGELHGVRFVENVLAPVLGGDTYKNKSGGVTYATYFFGLDSFGIIDPAGGGLEMIVHDKSEIGGPLNQFSTIGYKLETNGATILYPERLLRVMSVSSYSATDETN